MFHENLRNARENCNLSQKALADILKIPVTTYRNYENTLREPSYDILIKISKALNISTDELLGIKSNDSSLNPVFSKIKQLPKKKLQMLTVFVDFLFALK